MYVGFVPEGETPLFVERIAEKTYLAVEGIGAGTVNTSTPTTISGSLDGAIDYCVLRSEPGLYYGAARTSRSRASDASRRTIG